MAYVARNTQTEGAGFFIFFCQVGSRQWQTEEIFCICWELKSYGV